jgi:hypothetical protein
MGKLVEGDLVWQTSTRTDGSGNCVEVAKSTDAILVRDTKDRQGPVLAFEPAAWTAFLDNVKAGRLDLE